MNKRMIRIFISSTFRNFKDERDLLMSEVYPKLEAICKNNGISFQVIDLRWGVSKEDAAENRSVQICFDEILRCQELSPELNFLIMAGDRYGWKPLPVFITKQEWSCLTNNISENSQDYKLLSHYYRQDKNDLELKYFLLPNSENPLYTEENDDRLRQFLYRQAEYAFKGNIPAKFDKSATELEIILGYLEYQGNNNTFIMLKKDKTNDSDESKELRRSAEDLKKRLKKSAENNSKCLVCEYSEGEKTYLAAAENYLTDCILKQINSVKTLSEYEQKSENLQDAYNYVLKTYYTIPEHDKILKAINENIGKCILLTGMSGSGKSFFLKHTAAQLIKNNNITAAVFTDIQPLCRNTRSALSFIIDTLKNSGALNLENNSQIDDKKPIAWFESQLEKVRPDLRITIIIDSLDGLDDFGEIINESLFQIKLPPNVSFILSIPSVNSINTADLKSNMPVICSLSALSGNDRINLLNSILNDRGRRLQDEQISSIKKLLPNNTLALTVELLAQLFQKLHCWNTVVLPKEVTVESLVRKVILLTDRNDYKIFRLHTLGFIALSSAGLSESEIIDLLSRDNSVIEEIRSQTEWEFTVLKPGMVYKNNNSNYIGKIPVVLWAIFYAQIRYMMNELFENGILLIQFRHNILKQKILEILGDQERIKLLKIMSAYFDESSWFLKDNERVIENKRKVTEQFVLYEQLNMTGSIQKNMDNPLCIDAYIRCGMKHTIRAYLNTYGESELSYRIKGILKSKDLLYSLWNDSFLQSALSELVLDSDSSKDTKLKKMLLSQVGQTHFLVTEGLSYTASEGMFFPQLNDKCCYAINDDGFAAFYKDELLQIIDLNQGIITPVRTPSVKEECFLYWDNNDLIVRCRYKRLRYKYVSGKLIEYSTEKIKNWDNLIEPKKLSSQLDYREAECFGNAVHMNSNWLYYYQNNKANRVTLTYNIKQKLYVKTRGELAAIVIDGERLEIVDLVKQNVLFRASYPAITAVEWSQSGRNLLAVIRINTLVHLNIDKNKVIEKTNNVLTSDINSASVYLENTVEDIGNLFLQLVNHKQNAVQRWDSSLQTLPLFGAISVRYGWIACYYRTFTNNYVVIYRLKDFKRITKPMNTQPILDEEAVSDPLYPALDRNGVVINANHTSMLLDFEKKMWLNAPETSKRTKANEPKMFETLRINYASYMEKQLNLKRKIPLPQNKSFSLLGKLADGIESIKPKSFQTGENIYLQLRNSNIFYDGSHYWLIDKNYGMIHIFDSNGTPLCRNMIYEKILAVDFMDNNLYILPEHMEKIIIMRII